MGLSEIDQRIHLIFLLNISKMLRKMGLISITDYFPLYKIGIENGTLLHFGKLSYMTFISIMLISNWENQFDFSRFLIQNYISELSEDTQLDCETWAYAHMAYSMKDFKRSLNLLDEHAFQIPYFNIISRGLRLQIYFEDFIIKPNENMKFILGYCKSNINWIRVQKTMSRRSRESFIRFTQVVQKMIKEFAEPDFEEERFLKILENINNIQGLDWLRAKRDLIIKMKKIKPR